MFYKLALRNVRRGMRDYLIYFLTLMCGICLFYMFNSIGSQQAMLEVNQSTHPVLKQLAVTVGDLSTFVAVVMGLLVVYANHYLIRRRKKELGLYMTLGMGKGTIARLLLLETLLIGIVALAAGLVVGIFAAQGMGVVTAKLLGTRIVRFTFTFSPSALRLTILDFGIIFLVVMVLNFLTVSHIRLIRLLTGARRNESPKFRGTAVTVVSFLLAAGTLTAAYIVAVREGFLGNRIGVAILLGIAGTVLFFFSLSGFLLQLLRRHRRFYYRGLNMFVLRQINSRINTAFLSLSVICLMLFVTIGTLSAGVGVGSALGTEAQERSRYSATLTVDDPDNLHPSRQDGSQFPQDIEATLRQQGFPFDAYVADCAQLTFHSTDIPYGSLILPDAPLTNQTKYVKKYSEMAQKDARLDPENIMVLSLSDYNRALQLAGKPAVKLAAGHFRMLGSASTSKTDNYFLRHKGELTINGQTLRTAAQTVGTNHLRTAGSSPPYGLIVVPDSVAAGLPRAEQMLNIQYRSGVRTEQADRAMKEGQVQLAAGQNRTNGVCRYPDGQYQYAVETRTGVYADSSGLSATATYVTLYLGLVFLIAAAAILALQQLSEASDNAERYGLLRRLGTETRMIVHAIDTQVGIYFLLPLLLAAVHSIFGLKVVADFVSMIGRGDMFGNILIAAAVIVLVYGLYFRATCMGCRAMLRESGNESS